VRRISAVTALVLAVLPSVAVGNSAADVYEPPGPAGAGGVVLRKATALEVAREDLTLDCEEERSFGHQDGELACRFVAEYWLVNPRARAEAVQGAFFGYELRDVVVTVVGADGEARAAGVDLSAAERDALLRKIEKAPGGRQESVEIDAVGFRISVPGNGRRTLRVAGVMTSTAGFTNEGGYGFMRPDQWTHPLMNEESRVRTESDTEYAVDYLIYPIRTWKKVGPIDLRLRWDSGLELESRALKDKRLDLVGAGGELTTTLDARETPVLDLKLTRRRSTFYEVFQPGGPELRLGVRFGGESRATLGSVGWDWSFFHAVSQSLSYERGSDGYAAVVPMLFKVNLLILHFGFGLPQVQGERQSGIRLQGGLTVPAVGITYFHDRFGARGELPARRQSGLAIVLTI
jgi:hypothetical protein